MSAAEVMVVGCGVVGLGAALNVQRNVPGCRVRIVADSATPHTTGDGAAGLWGPYMLEGTEVDKIIEWSSSTWDLFNGWMKSGTSTSVMLVPGVTISNEELQPEPWRHIPLAYRHLDQPTIRKRFGDGYVSAYEYTSLVAEPSKFMPELIQEFKAKGGIVERRRVASLEEEAKNADILVNCSGLGARELIRDDRVYPVRGQLMRVRAPWVDTFFADESDENFCYIIPNTETVVLGGTHQEDDDRLTVDLDDKRNIWNRCTASMPSLQGSEWVRDWVGLRPARRGGVRLEEDVLTVGGCKVPVLHNYGHGGAGVSLFWGCGEEVAKLVGRSLHRSHGPQHQCSKL